jgi:hypothetical protein
VRYNFAALFFAYAFDGREKGRVNLWLGLLASALKPE